jgi:hypothetical protein
MKINTRLEGGSSSSLTFERGPVKEAEGKCPGRNKPKKAK